jgi:hypothetical protein
MADKTVDYNINVNVMNDQIKVIRDVVRECISEMDPEVAIIVMDKLNKKLSTTYYRQNEIIPEKVDLKKLQDAEIIEFENAGLIKYGK